jgi:hypothetical protein
VRDGIEKCGLQFLALTRGFGQVFDFLGPRSLEADRHEAANGVKGRVRHDSSKGKNSRRFGPQPNDRKP